MNKYEVYNYLGMESVLKNGKQLSARETKSELDNQQTEINELKAMVNNLIGAAKHTDINFRFHAKVNSDDDTVLSVAMAKTPPQCLASVKADAVKEFINHIQYAEEDELINEEGINESFDYWNDSYNKLLEQSK